MMIKPQTQADVFFDAKLKHFNAYQQAFLNSLEFPDQLLLEAVQYVMQSPGKKFRAQMVYATGQLFQLSDSILDPIALSIELIHAYSLVHDDLPAMDNDDYRRGRLSCHKAFDEATAILTGNTLHHLAFGLLIQQLPIEYAAPVLSCILEHIGPQGILSGQSMDLKMLKQNQISLEQLIAIHHLKTSSLLEAVVESVGICAKASQEIQMNLIDFARHLGLAYQMLDDYGDVYTTESWGKKKSSDTSNEKFTFVQFFSKEDLKSLIIEEFNQSKHSIQNLNQSIYLIHLVEQIEKRLQ